MTRKRTIAIGLSVWDAIDFHAATIHITRKKHGQPATHQIRGDELRALRKLQKEQEPKSAFVFASERTRFIRFKLARDARQPRSGPKSDARLLLYAAGTYAASTAPAAERRKAEQTAPINTDSIRNRRKRSAD
jgi:hypothetical protein